MPEVLACGPIADSAQTEPSGRPGCRARGRERAVLWLARWKGCFELEYLPYRA